MGSCPERYDGSLTSDVDAHLVCTDGRGGTELCEALHQHRARDGDVAGGRAHHPSPRTHHEVLYRIGASGELQECTRADRHVTEAASGNRARPAPARHGEWRRAGHDLNRGSRVGSRSGGVNARQSGSGDPSTAGPGSAPGPDGPCTRRQKKRPADAPGRSSTVSAATVPVTRTLAPSVAEPPSDPTPPERTRTLRPRLTPSIPSTAYSGSMGCASAACRPVNGRTAPRATTVRRTDGNGRDIEI